MPAGYVNGYLYLEPGTYSVAVAPTGEGFDRALIGPLDVPLVAGHRYTLALMGQLQDQSVTPLLIDETAAETQIGAKPTDAVRITVNNLASAAGLDTEGDGKLINKNIPYGGFDAGIYSGGNAPIRVSVSDDAGILLNDSADWSEPGSTFLLGFAGKYPITEGYVPRGSLSKTPRGPFDRSFTTLFGATITIGDGFTVNRRPVGDFESYFVANGTQVHPSTKVLLPEPTGTASDSPTATAGDVPTNTAAMTFAGPTNHVTQASFAPDGKTIFTTSNDQTARLWDVQTGKELRRFVGHTDEVRTVVFAPDGNALLTASQDGTARLWHLN